jgi:HTH-type transcriptional regulator/antitoxin HipB
MSETPIRSPRQVAQIIKRARTEKGLTQEELAEKSGFSQVAISKAENTEADTKISTVLKLLAVLDYELLGKPRPETDPNNTLNASIGEND